MSLRLAVCFMDASLVQVIKLTHKRESDILYKGERKEFAMTQEELKQQSEVIKERIKERPVNKKKLLRKTLTTAFMAVMFGLIASLTFIFLEPLVSNWLYPETKPDPVIFPEIEDEVLPEDMLLQDEDLYVVEEEELSEEEARIQAMIDNIKLDRDKYEELYKSLADYTKSLQNSMVTVTAVTSNADWLNETYERKGQTYGVIIADNGKEYMILTDRNAVKYAKNIEVSLRDDIVVYAQMVQSDEELGIGILSIKKEDVPSWIQERIIIAPLGSSNFRQTVGTPIIIMGCPMGVVGSTEYGIVSTEGNLLNRADVNYKMFATDIFGSASGTGVVFNLRGQIVGVVTTERYSSEIKNNLSFIGISELRKQIENMANAKETPYIGIVGVDVPLKANKEQGIPMGAYVKDVKLNSPAMLAGIQNGDVIIEFDGQPVDKFTNYTTLLQDVEPGEEVKLVLMRPVQERFQKVEINLTVIGVK